MRTLAGILEEVTAAEQKYGVGSEQAKALIQEARNHPSAAPGKDLPPIIGRMGAPVGF